MPLYHLNGTELSSVEATRFVESAVREREDLQRVLRDRIEVVGPDLMVLAEEFSDWEDSRRRVDLLCLDEEANVVVVELKRSEGGGHMELQALRYAAMVSRLRFDRAAAAHARHLSGLGVTGDVEREAERRILDFLGWGEVEEERFAQQVRIVLVSADLSTELTTAVLWLNEQGIDIRCVRLRPHEFRGEVLLAVEQVIPLKSAEAYQVRLREKTERVRAERSESIGSGTGFYFVNIGEDQRDEGARGWELSRELGYVSAGGGPKWVRQIQKLSPGMRFFAYVSRVGYVGVGEVFEEPTPREEFVPEGHGRPLSAILEGRGVEGLLESDRVRPPERKEYCAGVRWLAAVDREHAVEGPAQRHAVCRLRHPEVVQGLLAAFGLEVEGAEGGDG